MDFSLNFNIILNLDSTSYCSVKKIKQKLAKETTFLQNYHSINDFRQKPYILDLLCESEAHKCK